MMRSEHNIVIDRSVEEFFAFLSNPVDDPHWNSNIIAKPGSPRQDPSEQERRVHMWGDS